MQNKAYELTEFDNYQGKVVIVFTIRFIHLACAYVSAKCQYCQTIVCYMNVMIHVIGIILLNLFFRDIVHGQWYTHPLVIVVRTVD